MSGWMQRNSQSIVVAVVTAALTMSAPALASAVVDFARNSDKVDGFHAVGSASSKAERAGKLLATDQGGHFPNNVVRKVTSARNADRFGDRTPAAYAMNCDRGVLRGQAVVPTDVGPEYEDVVGFSTTYGGPVGPAGTNCRFDSAQAKHVGTGTYRVWLGTVLSSDCPDESPDELILGAVVTPIGPSTVGATYTPVCEDGGIVAEVHLSDANGLPMDSSFSVALFDENGVPIP